MPPSFIIGYFIVISPVFQAFPVTLAQKMNNGHIFSPAFITLCNFTLFYL